MSVQVSPDRSQIIDLIEEPMLKVELDSVVGLIQEMLGEHSINGIKKKKSLHHILFPNQFFKPKGSFLLGFVLKILVHLFEFLQILLSNA